MNIMFSFELARRPGSETIAVNCLNPGFNVTGLGRDLPLAAPLERLLRFMRIGDPERGASLITRLATDPNFVGLSGAYVTVPDARPLIPAAPANDAVARSALWSATAGILRTYL